MRTKLLLSTAAMALMLTAPTAFAQSNPDKKPEAAKEQTQAKPAHQERSTERKVDENKAAASSQQRNAEKNAQQNAQQNMKDENARKQNADRGAMEKQNKSANTKTRSTTGQSTPEQQNPAQVQKNATGTQQQNAPSAAQQNNAVQQNNNASRQSTTNNSTTNNNTAPTRNATQQNTTSVNAQLAPEKQTRISETISRTRDVAPPVRDLRISVNVGTRVPERVRLHRLPREIVSIEPAYREYDYFTTEEDIVIVNPHTRQVVTMLPRDASRARAEAGSSSMPSRQVSSASSGMSGAAPCQVLRREASGETTTVNPSELSRSTTGSGAADNGLAVRVQAPNGQDMPPIQLGDRTGQIVVATDGNDCKITIEPGMH